MVLNVQRWLTRQLASHYAYHPNEKEMFADAWACRKKFASDGDVRDLKEASSSEIQEALTRVQDAVIRGRQSNALGHKHIKHLPTQGRYVVFSDHHAMGSQNRQDFFSLRNASLYAQVLDQYHGADFTLVENGDVEDLVIFEPTPEEMRLRASYNSLAQLVERRNQRLPGLLQEVLSHREYETVTLQRRRFAREGRFVRIVGNHDYQYHRMEELREKFWRNLTGGGQVPEGPYDYLLLQSSGTSTDATHTRPSVDYVIMHGHQFDPVTNPVVAPQLGETISECLGGFFQGPDRTWGWRDDASRWMQGHADVPNYLVKNTLTRLNIPLEDALSFLVVASDHDGISRSDLLQLLSSVEPGLLKYAIESLFHHPIAWEYFENETAAAALVDEVFAGNEFFKFRHLDEQMLRKKWSEMFPDEGTRPTLVLGHTHEVRDWAGRSETSPPGAVWGHYLNSGAAGRFENLIWAIEIVNGLATVVGWSSMRLRPNEAPRPYRLAFSSAPGADGRQSLRPNGPAQPNLPY